MHNTEENDELLEIYASLFDEGGQTRRGKEVPITKLVQLFRSPDPGVRSRAARLVGRYSQFQSFVARRLEETDPRVRANAVESLWRIDTPTARRFLETAAEDSHHRARVNALVGLYWLGIAAAVKLLFRQTRHHSPAFRVAAAWAIGQVADPRFLAVVQEMVLDQDEKVREVAALSKVRVEERLKTLRQAAPARVKILRTGGPDSDRRSLSVVLPREIAESVKPTDFVIEENERTVFDYDVNRFASRLPTRLGIAIPEPREESSSLTAWIDAAETELTSLIGAAADTDSFAVLRYKHADYKLGRSGPGPRAVYAGKEEVISQMPRRAAAGDLQEVLNALSAGNNGWRDGELTILIVADVNESGSDAGDYCPDPAFVSGLRGKVAIHVIAAADGEGHPLRAACAATASVFFQARSAEELKDACVTLFGSLADRFEIRYSSAEELVPGSSVSVSVYTEHGWGEDTQMFLVDSQSPELRVAFPVRR